MKADLNKMCSRCGINKQGARTNSQLGICLVKGKKYLRHLWVKEVPPERAIMR